MAINTSHTQLLDVSLIIVSYVRMGGISVLDVNLIIPLKGGENKSLESWPK
jgi:hypothetical protein